MVEKRVIKDKSHLIRWDCFFLSHASFHWLPFISNFWKQSCDIYVWRKSVSIM